MAFPLRTKLKQVFDVIFSERIKNNFLQAVPLWLASLFTGVIAVLYTQLFNLFESLLHDILTWERWFIFILAPFNFLLGWLIVRSFAPNAKGSGIPQVMAALELSSQRYEKGISKLLSFRILLVKIISSLCMVLGGGAIGREGPTIQIAGSVFRIIHKYIPETWPRLSQKSYIMTGAAAGLAAAFNTPLGGIVFAIEELAKVHLSFFRTALFSAVIISGLTAQAMLGSYLYLGYPDVKHLESFIYLGVVVSAIIAGLLGAYMCRVILLIKKWKQSFNFRQTICFVVGSGLLVAFLYYFFSEHTIGTGKGVINEVLFTDNKYVGWQTAIARIIGPVISFNSGAAGGVFAPSLAAGAAIGSFFSELFGYIGASANILILCGMVGFLTGVTRTPFTSAILVLEMTDRHNVIFHLMLAALVSNIAAYIVSRHSLYEVLKDEYVDDVKRLKRESLL